MMSHFKMSKEVNGNCHLRMSQPINNQVTIQYQTDIVSLIHIIFYSENLRI